MRYWIEATVERGSAVYRVYQGSVWLFTFKTYDAAERVRCTLEGGARANV